MTTDLIKQLERIEYKLDLVLKMSDWVSEGEAMKILNRSQDWLKKQRNGYKLKGFEVPPSLGDRDWRRGANGRSIEYKRTSLEKMKIGKFIKDKV